MLGLSWPPGRGGVMRHWELPFGREKWRTDHNFGRIGISDFESLHIVQFLDDPKIRIFNGFSHLSGFRRSRSRPGRAGSFGVAEPGPGARARPAIHGFASKMLPDFSKSLEISWPGSKIY